MADHIHSSLAEEMSQTAVNLFKPFIRSGPAAYQNSRPGTCTAQKPWLHDRCCAAGLWTGRDSCRIPLGLGWPKHGLANELSQILALTEVECQAL